MENATDDVSNVPFTAEEVKSNGLEDLAPKTSLLVLPGLLTEPNVCGINGCE